MKILNFGSLNIDYVYRVAHILQPGETLKAGEMEVFPGGKGLNQSIAAARAGAEVYHAGMVGAEDGGFLLDVCRENQVNTDYIRRGQSACVCDRCTSSWGKGKLMPCEGSSL